MKTFTQKEVIMKATMVSLFLAVFFVPTLSVYADEFGDVSDAGGDTAFPSSVSDAGGDYFYTAYDNDMWPSIESISDAGGDTAVEFTVSDAGGDTRYEDVVEIAYVYEETSYPYYYDTSYNGYSGFSAGYSYTYPYYQDNYNGNYNYNYNYTYQTPQARPTCTFSASRTVIGEGDSILLTWSTSNASIISINGGIGDVSRSGTRTVSPSFSQTYVLVADGPGGSVWCSETITVDEDDNNDPSDVQCDSFTVSDSRVDEGDRVTLTWRTTGADDVDINHGVGDVDDDGSRQVTLYEDTTFTLTARDGNDTDMCQVTVTVDEDHNNDNDDDNDRDNDVQCDSFTVSDSRVDEGDRVTLTWRTTGADDVDINHGVGDVDDDGSESVTVDEDTTFTLTARDGNDTDTCRVTVRVDDNDDNNDGNDRNAPRCTFHISDTTIQNGGSTILSWNNDRTDRMVIKDSDGKTIADSRRDRDIDEDTDAYTVRPRESTTYTMSVYNGNVRRTCELEVTVGSRVVGGITLSSVPYTGFDAGPVLTTIFYTVLVVWGLILAYVLVIRKRDDVKEVVAEDWSLTDPIESDEVSIEHEVPMNLPVSNGEEDPLRIQELETYAHTQYALVSSDALRFIAGQSGTPEEQRETLDRVINLAKTKYPKEGEWVVINKERVLAVLA